ncbi:MAG TPA: hypothetical protein VHZ51_24475 [Ktedonobacteraceae bacterium]|nr:hypothetical protein [Ktedonobacteraceae bacterium]
MTKRDDPFAGRPFVQQYKLAEFVFVHYSMQITRLAVAARAYV